MHLWTSHSMLIRQQVSSICIILLPWLPCYLLCKVEGGEYFLAWCIPIGAYSGQLEWCVLQHRKHKASATRYPCICPPDWWAAVDRRPGWKSALARVASTTPCAAAFPPECVYTAVCVFGIQAGLECELLLDFSQVSLWWPPLICAVFSQQTERVCFPSLLEIKRCLKGLSVAFSWKDDDTSKHGLLSQ